MALKQTLQAQRVIPMPNPKGSEVVNVRLVYDSAVEGALALNDVVELGLLPEGCVPVDWILDVSDLDSNGSPAIVMSVGILTAAKTAISTATADGGAAWATGLTTAQAGGMVRPTTRPTYLTQPSTSPRSVGVLISTAAATFQAGTLALNLSYRAAYQGA